MASSLLLDQTVRKLADDILKLHPTRYLRLLEAVKVSIGVRQDDASLNARLKSLFVRANADLTDCVQDDEMRDAILRFQPDDETEDA